MQIIFIKHDHYYKAWFAQREIFRMHSKKIPVQVAKNSLGPIMLIVCIDFVRSYFRAYSSSQLTPFLPVNTWS